MHINVKLAPADSILDQPSVSNAVKKRLLKAIHASLVVKDVLNAQVLTLVHLVNPTPPLHQITNVVATTASSGTPIQAHASRVATPAQLARILTSVRRAQPGLNLEKLFACSVLAMNSLMEIFAQNVALIV